MEIPQVSRIGRFLTVTRKMKISHLFLKFRQKIKQVIICFVGSNIYDIARFSGLNDDHCCCMYCWTFSWIILTAFCLASLILSFVQCMVASFCLCNWQLLDESEGARRAQKYFGHDTNKISFIFISSAWELRQYYINYSYLRSQCPIKKNPTFVCF